MAGDLTHSPADVIAQVLINLGLGTDPSGSGSWPVHVFTEPDSPDNCLTVYETTGESHGRDQITGETQEHYGIQVRVRSASPKTGYTKARDIAVKLAKNVLRTPVTIDSSTYLVQSVDKISNVLPVGMDAPESRRHLFTINSLTSVKETT